MRHPSNERIQEIRGRVARAVAQAGESPWLVGYDANGIQELVTAGSRPVIMRGASQSIADFDRDQRERPGNVFAGGGRGIHVVGSRARAEALVRALPEAFRRRTVIGVMAAAKVPLDGRDVRGSLRWLRHELELAKDAAGPPGGGLPLPDVPANECVNCQGFRATKTIERQGQEERVCERCFMMAKAGGKTHEMGVALVDVSACEREGAHQRRLAAVSADGNDLGAFFEEIDSLEALAAASEAIDGIFRHAHEQALAASDAACRKRFELPRVEQVPLMTGGDDVRAFLPPSGLLAYVDALAREVESGAEAAGDLDGLLGPATAGRLRGLGVGIGAVVAEDHFPARRLMAYAHALELRAKAACRDRAVRSAFDVEIVTSTQTVGVDLEDRRARGDGRPFALSPGDWTRTRNQARALYALPVAQRRVLDRAAGLDDVEFANVFRYQVARSEAWQGWYEAFHIDWRDRDVVMAERPGAGLLAMGSLLAEENP